MRFGRLFPLAVIGAIVSWQPLAASAAWDFEKNGPHKVDKTAEVPSAPKESRSLAPKEGVALSRPVAPRAAEPSAGRHEHGYYGHWKVTGFEREPKSPGSQGLASD